MCKGGRLREFSPRGRRRSAALKVFRRRRSSTNVKPKLTIGLFVSLLDPSGALFNRMAPVLWTIAVLSTLTVIPPHALHLDQNPRAARSNRQSPAKPHKDC
jgi:hypothetical protein